MLELLRLNSDKADISGGFKGEFWFGKFFRRMNEIKRGEIRKTKKKCDDEITREKPQRCKKCVETSSLPFSFCPASSSLNINYDENFISPSLDSEYFFKHSHRRRKAPTRKKLL
jgi:hypothetical protein